MAVLVLATHNNAALDDTTARAVSAALLINAEVDVLVAGRGSEPAVQQAAAIAGVRKVLHAQGDQFAHPLAEEIAALVLTLSDGYDTFLAAATASGKNVMPRIAASLDVMQVSEIIAVLSADTFNRPVYAGNAILTLQSTDPKKVITVRTSAFAAASSGTTLAPVEAIATLPAPAHLSALEGVELPDSDRPELTSARVIVSGGRALGSEEQFNAILTPLADKLGAAIGASRAAVDAGFAPNNLQVGQTGKVVAPELYIAIGISGAIQHVAGMKDSKIIVAINKDANALIFQFADYGLVADAFEAVPELTRQL